MLTVCELCLWAPRCVLGGRSCGDLGKNHLSSIARGIQPIEALDRFRPVWLQRQSRPAGTLGFGFSSHLLQEETEPQISLVRRMFGHILRECVDHVTYGLLIGL